MNGFGALLICFVLSAHAMAQEAEPERPRRGAEAEQMLNQAIADRNYEPIRFLLAKGSFPVKNKAALAMADLADRAFVPDLIVALDQNRGVSAGGSEIQIEQEMFNKAIISSLESLIGRKFEAPDARSTSESKFPIPDEYSVMRIRRILDQSRAWWNKNKPQN